MCASVVGVALRSKKWAFSHGQVRVNIKQKASAHPPQEAPEMGEVKSSQNMPPKGNLSKYSNLSKDRLT